MGRKRRIAERFQRRVLFFFAILGALGSLHCAERELGAVPVGAPADAGDAQSSVLDASLPQADADFDTADDLGTPPDADAPDAYILPENSIKTCGEFLSCMSNCPPEVTSCVGPCHDAMTRQAAADVREFLNCAARNHCRDQDCLMANCGTILRVCMR